MFLSHEGHMFTNWMKYKSGFFPHSVLDPDLFCVKKSQAAQPVPSGLAQFTDDFLQSENDIKCNSKIKNEKFKDTFFKKLTVL